MAKTQDFVATFACHGVELSESGTDQWVGTCPFCGRGDHFYVNVETGQWDCKNCGLSGNHISFLGQIAERTYKETHPKDWARLAAARGLPVEVFKEAHMGWNGREWLLPVYGPTGTVRDIRRWDGYNLKSTTGCRLQLYGLRELAAKQKLNTQTVVWLCEGEWDALAARLLLGRAGRNRDVVLGVPGAGTFKPEWLGWLRGFQVRICYDNDDAGDAGAQKVGELLTGIARKIEYLCWPKSRPLGWDVRDYVIESLEEKIPGDVAIRQLEELVHPRHRLSLPPESGTGASENGRAGGRLSGEDPDHIPFKQVVKGFKRWIEMDRDLEDALAVSLAVAGSNDIPGDPLWCYLVGPPGSGKTVILMSLQGSPRTLFFSTLTPKSLVSGFNVHPDPSLLPKLDGKTAVFKDGTELLTIHPDARREAYGILRGAFDGSVYKTFGNGVVRDYKLHFNMLIGVTMAIHGDEQATMGERFLKFELREYQETVERKIRRAISNISKEVEMEAELSDLCRRFLSRPFTAADLTSVSMPPERLDQIISLSQILAMLRAHVDHVTPGDRDPKYQPVHEVGTRIAKQLAKMGGMLALVYGQPVITDDIYRVLQKIAIDTCIGYHYDIVNKLMQMPEHMSTQKHLAKITGLPATGIGRRLSDLQMLKVLDWAHAVRPLKENEAPYPGRPGPTEPGYEVSYHMYSLWKRAGLQHTNGHIPRLAGRADRWG